MNKKAFTLVELLAVISILAIVLLLGSISVAKMVKDSKEQIYNVDIVDYIMGAKLWSYDNPDLLPDMGSSISLTGSSLVLGGYVDKGKINPLTKTEYNVTICIFNTNMQYSYELLTKNNCDAMH